MGKAAELRVQDVERHLRGIEMEIVRLRHLQHAQMHHRILVPGEADVANLAGLLRFQQRIHHALVEEPVRIFHADVLVILHQVHLVRLQPLQRFVDLLRGGGLGAAVELGHQEHLLAVTVAQSLAHPDLALAVHVIPAVVHERDAAVDGRTDQPHRLLLVLGNADVVAAHADGGDPLPVRPSLR